MERYRNEQFDGIAISSECGYHLKDLSFLRRHDYVAGIVIPHANNLDIADIRFLRNLKLLSLASTKQSISLADFPVLDEVRLEWHAKVSLNAGDNLKILSLRQYQKDDLSELSNLRGLTDLSIIQSPMCSLRGIGVFVKLIRIELSYLSKLVSLSALRENPDIAIEVLECENCPNIIDHDVIGLLKHLRILKLNRCGAMKSIDFIKSMSSLREFYFVGTNVKDGNISPLVDSNHIRKIGFTDKSNFSMTYNEVTKQMGISN